MAHKTVVMHSRLPVMALETSSQPEIRAAEDITNHVELALENWWYASEDQRAEADANRNVDFSAYAWEENAQAGMTLRFRAEAVAGDWFSVTFPEAFAELGLAQTYSCTDWMRYWLAVTPYLSTSTLMIRMRSPNTLFTCSRMGCIANLKIGRAHV